MTEPVEPKRMGRPHAMTQEHVAEICLRVADGETIRQIARDEHMPHSATIYRELGRPGDFCDQYTKAKEAQLVRWEDEIIEIADDGSNDWIERELDNGRVTVVGDTDHMNRSRLRVDTRKWVMSKRAPKKYGDRAILQGDDDADPIRSKVENMSDFEAARRIAFILAKATTDEEPGQ